MMKDFFESKSYSTKIIESDSITKLKSELMNDQLYQNAVFYYTGHGDNKDRTFLGSFLPFKDGELSMQELFNITMKIKSNSLTYVMDCCSGSFYGHPVEMLNAKRTKNRCLCASYPDSVTGITTEGSAFTRKFIDASDMQLIDFCNETKSIHSGFPLIHSKLHDNF